MPILRRGTNAYLLRLGDVSTIKRLFVGGAVAFQRIVLPAPRLCL